LAKRSSGERTEDISRMSVPVTVMLNVVNEILLPTNRYINRVCWKEYLETRKKLPRAVWAP
jgi:hypothetical protein